MPTKINLKINYINDLLLFTSNNNTIIINKIITENGIEFKENVNVNFHIEESLSKKEYYIYTNYYDYYSVPLTKYNFIITFNTNEYILYDYIPDTQTIYIYNEYINIPFNMIGIINYKENFSVLVICILNTIYGITQKFITSTTLVNNNLKDDNVITLPGNIISINSIIIVNAVNITFNYYLFETSLPIVISDSVKIYIYDSTFIRIINIPIKDHDILKIDSINVLVELIGSSGIIVYSYITNLNLNLVKSNNKSSYVLAFKNYIDSIEFDSIILRVFDYDYYIYFSELVYGDYIKCVPINLDKANLYEILILPNTNIPSPTIPDLNIVNFNTYIDVNNLDDVFDINKNLANDFVEKILYSTNERFNIVLDYLVNFNMKKYNFYNITFSTNIYDNNLVTNSINYNLYVIDNNLVLNSILTNIQIFYNDIQSNILNYNIYGMLLNNNNTWDTYTKKYPLNNPVNKYNILKDLLIMAINYLQIVVYTYNDIDDLNSIKVTQVTNAGIIYTNNNWRYNKLILNKSNSKMTFGLDENYYLKMYFQVKLDYKLFVFYTDDNFSSSPSTNILNFQTEAGYYFKILKTLEPNGSTKTNKSMYSILFQDIEDCNDFIYYIQYGLLTRPEGSTSSYFNILTSKHFKLSSSGYYIISDTIPNTISFQILDVNLFGTNEFVNNKIIYNN